MEQYDESSPFHRACMQKALEIVKGQPPEFNIWPTYLACLQIMSFPTWHITRVSDSAEGPQAPLSVSR